MLTFKQFLKEEIYSPLKTNNEIQNNADFINKTNRLLAAKRQKSDLENQIKRAEQTYNAQIENGKQKIQKMNKTSPTNVNAIKNTIDKSIESINNKIEKDKKKLEDLNKNIEDLQNQLENSKTSY